MKQFYLFIFLSYFNANFAQDFGIGTWREHLPYSKTIAVDKIDSKTYAATPYGIYYFDEEDNSLERINKINGLSDLSVSAMQANSSQNVLVIGYESGNIDIIKNDRIINVSAIVSSNLSGDKQIYKIHNEGKYAYLACGFGIVVLDVSKEEIKDTYIFGPGGSQMRVNDVTLDDNTIYAATEIGVFKADKNNAFLSNYAVWSQDVSISNSSGDFSIVHYANGRVYANLKIEGSNNDTLYFLENGTWNQSSELNSNDQFSIENKGQNLLICQGGRVVELDINHSVVETLFTYKGERVIEPNACIWDGKNYCIADENYGLNISFDNWTSNNYLLTGPFSNHIFHLTCRNEKLSVATGRVSGTIWNNEFTWQGIYTFDQYNWKAINGQTSTELANSDTIFDFIYSTIDPTDASHIFASSFQGGLIEIQGTEVINRYTYYNSSLQISTVHGGGAVKISGTAFDKSKNLWVANAFTANPLSVLTPDGDWQSFYCGDNVTNQLCTDLFVDQNDYVWIAFKNIGLLVYDYNSTPLDVSDDQFRLITNAEGNGNLPSLIVNDIAEGLNGEIWVGTETGPAVFYNTQAIFDGNNDFDAQQILINQDGVIQILLETENVADILIDGADRKWFGTEGGGLFLMSSDATELIHSFSIENSPLFSNVILALAMNDVTGELYVGTDLGIMGYKGEATKGATAFSDVYAYPNPVRSGYTGLIGIKGLMESSDVKITDAAGNLVFSTIAQGGQAVWDGNNLRGERVATGVYYCFAVSENGVSKASTKILFIQ